MERRLPIKLKEGNDCFVYQSTGSGKSVIFHSLPFFVHACSEQQLQYPTDQIKYNQIKYIYFTL